MRINGMNANSTVMAVLQDKKESRTDKYELDWNGFWHYVNVMQFNTNAYFLSASGLEKDIYTILGTIVTDDVDNEVAATVSIEIDAAWNDYMDDFLEDIARTCATEMMNNGIKAPSTIGYELEDSSRGAVIGEAEIVWESDKIAWLLPEQLEYQKAFEDNGWIVIKSTDKVENTIFGGDTNE